MPDTPPQESYVAADTSVPLRPTTVGGVLREMAARRPDATALVFGAADPSDRRSWTYQQLLDESEALARALATRFERGDRLAVWAANLPEWIVLEFAAGLAGVVLVTVNPSFQPKELAYVLQQSRAKGIVYQRAVRGNALEAHLQQVRPDLADLELVVPIDELGAMAAAADPSTPLPEVSPEDPAQIQYTSGTTGFPKGAYLHHLGITNNARLFSDRLNVSGTSTYVSAMPLFHTGGCVLAVLGATQAGGTLVKMEQFDPALMLELIEEHGATHVGAVPTMLIACMEHPDFVTRDLSSLEVVCSGGATVPADLVRRIESQLGVSLCIVYGQTEASPAITLARPDDSPRDKAETLGPVLPQVEVKIVDPDTGETVPVGVAGELCARGYLVMHSYFEMPDKTAEAIDEDGWLHTGDLASMDERGYCTIAGRLKDMIIRGGENIYPREIEELLFTHPKVADVAVVGLPDPTWGEIVAAFVRDADPSDPATDEELRAFCRDHLSPQKTPTRWIHVDAFPLTPSGKIQKFVLADEWAQEQASEQAPAPSP